MKFVLDESVSYSLAEVLRDNGYPVIAFAESNTSDSAIPGTLYRIPEGGLANRYEPGVH